MMKLVCKFSAIVLILFVFSSCNKSEKKSDQIVEEPLSITIELLNEKVSKNALKNFSDYDGDKPYIDNINYEVEITLNNNTDSILHFVSMTCSWDQNIIINTPYITYLRDDCNSNYPHVINIEPHDRRTLRAFLENKRFVQGSEKEVDLRMGLIMITDVADYDSIMEDKSAWSVIWSNPITLNID